MNETFKRLSKQPWASQLHDNQNHDTENLHWTKSVGSMCKQERTMSEIVECAFRWTNTPQGHEYWMNIKNGLN